MIGVLASGTLSDRLGRKSVLIGLTVATPISMLVFLYCPGWFRGPALVLVGLASFTSTPVILALIQRRGFAFPSIANGIYMTINFVLGSALVLLAGALSDRIGIEATFLVFAICSLASIPFAFLVEDGGVAGPG